MSERANKLTHADWHNATSEYGYSPREMFVGRQQQIAAARRSFRAGQRQRHPSSNTDWRDMTAPAGYVKRLGASQPYWNLTPKTLPHWNINNRTSRQSS